MLDQGIVTRSYGSGMFLLPVNVIARTLHNIRDSFSRVAPLPKDMHLAILTEQMYTAKDVICMQGYHPEVMSHQHAIPSIKHITTRGKEKGPVQVYCAIPKGIDASQLEELAEGNDNLHIQRDNQDNHEGFIIIDRTLLHLYKPGFLFSQKNAFQAQMLGTEFLAHYQELE